MQPRRRRGGDIQVFQSVLQGLAAQADVIIWRQGEMGANSNRRGEIGPLQELGMIRSS